MNVSAHDDLVAKKVNPLFVDEFMGGIVRNTYGQSLR